MNKIRNTKKKTICDPSENLALAAFRFLISM